jgi:hypothetical protein
VSELNKLNPVAFGQAGAFIAAMIMLLLGILGNLGVYTGAVGMMMEWHIFFDLSVIGIISGIIEGAVISFIFLYLFAEAYNRLTK